ncbi:RluA family pseudouridine synthase [Thiomicrorhabdus sediminis]|uniref:RNA pseudouridine synthase n=1 Tax=Thiomicrorhabdus sediminis TaxID=2580412 RepID=A0A4P9K864_9GAMM|nr:RNA pseudouridine synthase [Thiomicrorhabdus sediminis]QCU90660.1 RNA pseudouridine synthase [Thiomicrorhabdus sediminis]
MTNFIANNAQHYQLVATRPIAALELLAQQTGLSKQQLKDAAQKGALWITRHKKAERLRRVKTELKAEQQLDLYYNPAVLQQSCPAATLISDQHDYSLWCKPRGMLSQGSKWGDFSALYRWVEMHYQPDGNNRQCWLVHRLDRATCGLQLLAHNKKTAQKLTALFEHNQVKKQYQAWVHGKLQKPHQSIATPIDNKKAVTHIQSLQYLDDLNISLLDITIEQGRKHQIRKHLASIHHPIVGDRLHGSADLDKKLNAQLIDRDQLKDPNFAVDLQLTAYKISFICPIEKKGVTYQLEQNSMDFYPFSMTD